MAALQAKGLDPRFKFVLCIEDYEGRKPQPAPYLAAKGSITVDGVSLTVNEVADQPDGTCHFALNLIPHSAEVTTLGALQPGDKVNLEIDVLARYLQRMQSLRS